MSNVKAFITDVNRDGFHEVAEAIRASGGKDAEHISYDNTESGLAGDNVQAAIDEVAGDVSDLDTAVNGLSGDVDDLETAVSGLADDVDALETAVSEKVSKSGDTMTGKLTVENDIECTNDIYTGWVYSNAYSFKGTPAGGKVDLVSRATIGNPVQIEVPQKNGTMALTSDIPTLQKSTKQYTLSEYYKNYSWYTITAPTDHTYKFVTLNDWSSGSQPTSPFSVLYNGTNLYVIVGSVEPVRITVDFWYVE